MRKEKRVLQHKGRVVVEVVVEDARAVEVVAEKVRRRRRNDGEPGIECTNRIGEMARVARNISIHVVVSVCMLRFTRLRVAVRKELPLIILFSIREYPTIYLIDKCHRRHKDVLQALKHASRHEIEKYLASRLTRSHSIRCRLRHRTGCPRSSLSVELLPVPLLHDPSNHNSPAGPASKCYAPD